MRPAQATDPISTDRLTLTPIGIDDADDLMQLYSEPLVAYWTGPWTPDAVKTWASNMAARWARDGVGKWMAHDRIDDVLVGRGGLSRVDLEGEEVLELGWVVRDGMTGRGYATEIGQAGLRWAAAFFPGVPVVSFTEVHNRASLAVMRRLGLRDCGVIHREGLIEGRPGLHRDAPFALYRSLQP